MFSNIIFQYYTQTVGDVEVEVCFVCSETEGQNVANHEEYFGRSGVPVPPAALTLVNPLNLLLRISLETDLLF